jgi:hypothetical protein
MYVHETRTCLMCRDFPQRLHQLCITGELCEILILEMYQRFVACSSSFRDTDYKMWFGMGLQKIP